MEEETEGVEPRYELGCVCTCVQDDVSSERVEIPARKQYILNTVARTENYLRDRRIPELIRFLFTKIIAEASEKPVAYLEQLLDDCMLFRAGHGSAPVLFEKRWYNFMATEHILINDSRTNSTLRHLEAIIKSFDPGNRGWLSAGQLRRIYSTLGLSPDPHEESYEEKYSCDIVLHKIKKAQERELFDLLSSGMVVTVLDEQKSGKSSIS